MNKISITTLFFSVLLFGERVNYWNLGISINDESTIIVQKKVDLNKVLNIQIRNIANTV